MKIKSMCVECGEELNEIHDAQEATISCYMADGNIIMECLNCAAFYVMNITLVPCDD